MLTLVLAKDLLCGGFPEDVCLVWSWWLTGEPRVSLSHFSCSYSNTQERKQRAELLEGLRSEMARLRQLHEVEVKGLQAELDERLTLLQNRHREKVRRLPSSLWLG